MGAVLAGCGDGADAELQTASAGLSSVTAANVRLQELTNSCGANQAQDVFKVVNAGTTPIPASDVSMKIWVDDTSGSDIVPRIDTGGCLLDRFGSCVHQVTGVTATATRLASACGPDSHHQANWEITIATTDHTAIGAGLVWSNIQLALHLANFSSFTPGTGSWYSECLSGADYAHVAHAAIYVRGDLVTASSGVPPSCRAPTGRQRIPGELPPAVANGDLPLVGPLPGDTPVHFLIGLPIQHEARLDTLIQDLYDPKSPKYRQYLTPDDFGAQFGVLPKAYSDLIGFAQSKGLTVEGQYSARTMLAVTGPASAVEQAFFVTLNEYRRHDGTTFYAPANEPSADLGVPVLHISGLDSFAIPRPAQGTGPSEDCFGNGKQENSYAGPDFRTAYLSGIKPSLDGAGETIGLVEFNSYFDTDPTQYTMNFMRDVVPKIVNVKMPCKKTIGDLTDPRNPCSPINFPPTDVQEAREVALDIEMAMAMAPGATIRVYEWDPNKPAGITSMLQQMAQDQVNIISSSWNWDVAVVDPNTPNVFKQFAVQGVSFFQAALDGGAYREGKLNVPEPIILSPLMTVVGGTILTTNASGGWDGETTWNNPKDQPNAVTGGGFCTGYTVNSISYPTMPIPSYQVSINPSNSDLAINPSARMIPDVSLIADQIPIYAADKTLTGTTLVPCTGGTSAATPLWAGVAALMNQQSRAGGGERIGFANPTLYALAAAGPASYAANFHDVKAGNNSFTTDPADGYLAVAGYDLATGLGTPTAGLLDALPPQSCMPGASLTVLISGTDVTAYVPNGSWSEDVTGIRVVPIEGEGSAVSIGTPRAVNTCGGNSVTGQVVCTSNDNDVYIINGTSLTQTLTSAANGTESFSGGTCHTCNVAIDPLHNQALLSIGTPDGAALQPLDLRTMTLGTPIVTGQPATAEDLVIDAVRGLALSPNEGGRGPDSAGDFQLVSASAGTVLHFSPPGFDPEGVGFDMAALDCSTRIAVVTDEETDQVFVADLSVASITPPTWSAPSQFQAIPDFFALGEGTNAIAIAAPSHLGVVSGEFGSATFGVFVLPSTSGSGTPMLQDWVVASLPDTPDTPDRLPWKMGKDPHTLTAYTSPKNGRQYAVFEDDVDQQGTRTFLAVVDLQAVLDLKPGDGSHTITAPLQSCTGPGPIGTPETQGCVVRFIPN